MALNLLKKAESIKKCLNQIWEESIYQKSKNVHYKTLKCFKKHQKKLSNYLIIIQQLYLILDKKTIHGERMKKPVPIQLFQRLPIALAEVKAGSTYENKLN